MEEPFKVNNQSPSKSETRYSYLEKTITAYVFELNSFFV